MRGFPSLQASQAARFAPVLLLALLTCCGQAPPTKRELQAALDRAGPQAWGLEAYLGRMAPGRVIVENSRCALDGRRVYACDTTATQNGIRGGRVFYVTSTAGVWHVLRAD